MGNALSIAATSRILRQIIEGNITRYGLDGYTGEDVLVTAEPPLDDLNRLRVNVFLYRTVQNPHLRNDALPGYDSGGRAVRPPLLTLDLHYAVTAYGENDYLSELMMGCAMQALHEVPVVDRRIIREILGADEGANSIMDSRLFEQIESIRIRHRNLTEEAFTRLWSAFNVPYRLTNFYEVSVVLIESDTPVRVANPVLARPRPGAHGSLTGTTPTLTGAREAAAAPGTEIELQGINLAGTQIRIEAEARDPELSPAPLDVLPANATATGIRFQIPADWAVGVYELRISLDPPDGGNRRLSNRISFVVLPAITVTDITRAPNPPGHVTIEMSVAPDIRPAQRVTLIVGGQSIAGPVITSEINTLVFEGLDLPPGQTVIRLQIDGIETAWLDRTAQPATVLPAAQILIP